MSETTSTTFVSPTNELRLVRENARRKPVGESGDFINIPGVDFQFRNGQLVVSDSDAVEWLRGHPNFQRLFFELGNEPERPGENSAAVQAEIMDLVFAGEYAKVADILVSERTTLGRPEVIAACESALKNAQQQVPEKPATPEHELELHRVGPTAGPPAGESVAETGEPVAA